MNTEDTHCSVWEASTAAGYDGKHPSLPPTPHRLPLSLGRTGGRWFPKGFRPGGEQSIHQRSNFQTTRRTSWFCTVGSQTIDTHTHRGKKHCHKSMHAHRHMHTVLHMLKPLSCCLLSHYSIACYFLKQEKAIYPQRSAERFATRRSLGIWEVTLKFEECGEVWNLRNREGGKKKSSSGTVKLLSRSLCSQEVYEMSAGREYYRRYWWLCRKSCSPPMGRGGTDIVWELWHIHGGSQTSGFHFPPLLRQWALAAGLFNEIVSSTSCAISLA